MIRPERVRNNEPIDIRFVVAGKNGQISLPGDLKSALAKQTAVLVSGNAAKTLNKVDESDMQYPQRAEVWCTVT